DRPGPLRRREGVLMVLEVPRSASATGTDAEPDAGSGPDVPGAAEALARARDHLLGLQSPEGWWKGELETNVTMDAEDLLLRHVLGILDPETTAAAATWIRNQQR